MGVKITPEIGSVVGTNYKPLVHSLKEMLNRWTLMPISMIGQIHIIKMTILPKFLYLFQSGISDTIFHKVNDLLGKCIWNNKKARLRLKLLYLPYEREEVQLPNLKWYYWATQLRAAMCYFVKTDCPAWVSIEQMLILGLPLKLYIYSDEAKTMLKQTHNPFLRNTISIFDFRHFIFSMYKLWSMSLLSKIEELTLTHMMGKGQLSLFYDLLLSHSVDSTFKKLEAWRRDMTEDIQAADLEAASFRAQTQSINTKLRLQVVNKNISNTSQTKLYISQCTRYLCKV